MDASGSSAGDSIIESTASHLINKSLRTLCSLKTSFGTAAVAEGIPPQEQGLHRPARLWTRRRTGEDRGRNAQASKRSPTRTARGIRQDLRRRRQSSLIQGLRGQNPRDVRLSARAGAPARHGIVTIFRTARRAGCSRPCAADRATR